MDWKKKLGSRKMWACLIGVLLGVGVTFGLDETEINSVAGSVTALVSIVTYVLTEGKIDAAAVKQEKQTPAKKAAK